MNFAAETVRLVTQQRERVWSDVHSKQLTVPVQLYFSMRKCQPDMGQFMTVSIGKNITVFITVL